MRDLKFQHGEGWPKAGMKPVKLIDGRTLIRKTDGRYAYNFRIISGVVVIAVFFGFHLFTLGCGAYNDAGDTTSATSFSTSFGRIAPMLIIGALSLMWGLYGKCFARFLIVSDSGVKVLKRGLFSGSPKVIREISAQDVESVAVRNMPWGNNDKFYGMKIALRSGRAIKVTLARCANSSAEDVARETAKTLGVRRVLNWDGQSLAKSSSNL